MNDGQLIWLVLLCLAAAGLTLYKAIWFFKAKKSVVVRISHNRSDKCWTVVGDRVYGVKGGELSAPDYELIRDKILYYIDPSKVREAEKRYREVTFVAGEVLDVNESDLKDFLRTRDLTKLHPVFDLADKLRRRVVHTEFRLYFRKDDGDHFAWGYPSFTVGIQYDAGDNGTNSKIKFVQNDKALFDERRQSFDQLVSEMAGSEWDGTLLGLNGLLDGVRVIDSDPVQFVPLAKLVESVETVQ